ncbi:creatininase family protein [Pelagicoccus sp. SDUM812003]|uniref:creatininase family protein n=1 Tax=Pelagicoccus sp. SDUM812003 TaxID=3041267 RepID=UPI00280F244F|nr:creatininase family protein [Pelagicoccus sp. SDUM812003]MDQ8202085.1 creatininase family protein [Pelagicoccus sp. SDUM812003]
MNTTASAHWEELTWEEISDLISSGTDAAILPIGATEQHGPQLTVGMDSLLGRHLCASVAQKTGVPTLPLLPYGCSLGHSHRWPGTLALSPQTLISVVTDIADWLYPAGIRKLFLVNSHVTNEAPLRCALEILRARYDDLCIALFNTGKLTPEIAATFSEDADDWHANAAETSLVLHLAPSSVRADKLASSDDPDRTGGCVFSHPVNRTSLNGVTGSPSQATAEAGKTLYQRLEKELVSLIKTGLSETPPLENSYFRNPETA